MAEEKGEWELVNLVESIFSRLGYESFSSGIVHMGGRLAKDGENTYGVSMNRELPEGSEENVLIFCRAAGPDELLDAKFVEGCRSALGGEGGKGGGNSMIDRRTHRAIVATSGRFSSEAHAEAKRAFPELRLIEGPELCSLALKGMMDFEGEGERSGVPSPREVLGAFEP